MTLDEALRLATCTDYAPNAYEQAEASAVLAAEIKRLQGERREVCRHLVGRDECVDVPGVVAAVLDERMEAQRKAVEVERLQELNDAVLGYWGECATEVERLQDEIKRLRSPEGLIELCQAQGRKDDVAIRTWARRQREAAEAAEKHKHVCGLQGFDPNRDECDGCSQAAEAYRKGK